MPLGGKQRSPSRIRSTGYVQLPWFRTGTVARLLGTCPSDRALDLSSAVTVTMYSAVPFSHFYYVYYSRRHTDHTARALDAYPKGFHAFCASTMRQQHCLVIAIVWSIQYDQLVPAASDAAGINWSAATRLSQTIFLPATEVKLSACRTRSMWK
jgi:hypothetical protein